MSDQNTKINKKVEIDLAELLKKDAPYLVEDDKVNLEKLGGLLSGKITEKEDDRFYFNWAGKDKVFQAIQAPAYSTLAPQKDKSIGWDETENLMIVGENLETLKLLLKPYFGKVKVIYIDPPYNTGNDFIYKDDFSTPLKDYLERTGQKNESGTKLTTNPEASGRYHSDWLNFMYPRLFMARNLLKDDGVIFISIGDNEVHHLRMILDEIYGEDNFVAIFPWKKRTAKSDVPFGVSQDYEWIISYTKGEFGAGTEHNRRYIQSNDYPNDKWRLSDLTTQRTAEERPNSAFTLIDPKTGKEYPCNPQRVWGVTKDSFQDYYNKGKIVFPDDYEFLNITIPSYRVFESEDKKKATAKFGSDEVMKAVSTQLPKEVGMSEDGNKEMVKLFGGKIFPFPKPVNLIKYILSITNAKEDNLILDFFAGSGTTGEAVYELNKHDKGKRKFILVQIDEKTDEKSDAYKAGYKSISEICIDRLKKVSENNSKELKYKVFKSSPSNFNLKEEFELTENKDLGEIKTNYLKELGLYVDQPTVATANTLDIVYEIILKNGFSLNSKIEELKLGANSFYKVNDAENELEIHISLDAKIEDNSVEAIRITEYKGKTFAFYDNALTDSQKINLNTFVKLQVI